MGLKLPMPNGIRGTCTARGTLWKPGAPRSVSIKATKPKANILMPTPVINWLPLSVVLRTPKSRPINPPVAIPAIKPMVALPDASAPIAPANAPSNRMPSSPILKRPADSSMVSPIAARVIGTIA